MSLPARPTRPPPTPPNRSPPPTHDASSTSTMQQPVPTTTPQPPAHPAAPSAVSVRVPIPPLLRTWHAFALKTARKRATSVTLNLLECSLSFDKAGGGGQRHREFGLAHLAAMEPGGSGAAAGGATLADREREVTLAFHTPQTAHSDGTVPSTLHVPMGLFDGDGTGEGDEASVAAGSVAPLSVTAQTQAGASINAPGPSGVGSAVHVAVYKKLISFESRAERDEFCDLVASVRLTGASVGVMGAIPGAILKQLEGNPAVLLFLELDTARAGAIGVDAVRRGLQRVAEAELGSQVAAAATAAAAGADASGAAASSPFHPGVVQLTAHMHSCTLSRFVILYGRLLTLFNTPSAAQNLLNGSSVTGAYKHARHTALDSQCEFIPTAAPRPPALLCGEQELISQSRSWLVAAAPAASHSSRGAVDASGEAGTYMGMLAAFSPSNVVAAASAALGFGSGAAAGDGSDGSGGSGASSSTSVRLRGCFFLTNHRLLFVQYALPPADPSSPGGSGLGSGSGSPAPPAAVRHVEMNLGSLERVEVSSRDDVAAPVVLFYSKYFRLLQVGFDAPAQWVESLVRLVSSVAFGRDQTKCFAFAHKDTAEGAKPLPPQLDGFNLYDPLFEYARVGLVDESGGEIPGRGFRVSYANLAYDLVPSYPRVLVVPACVSDEELRAVAAYRSSARLPAVVWRHPLTGASLSRCSQPLAGMRGKREEADEKLIAAIRQCNPTNAQLLYLMDARPLKAVLGNQLTGKGVENAADYPGTEIRFLGIDNIHHIRASHLKLVELLASNAGSGGGGGGGGGGSGANSSSAVQTNEASFYARLGASGWMGFVRLILASSVRIARVLSEEGASVTIHCSDGWDRTSQLCGLVQLMLDPHYRSLRGFAVLVESSWTSFGHQFALRHGHADPHYGDDQRAPIFLQLWRQYPCAFEFTEAALLFVMEHVWSCRFGTFLFNTERERHAANVAMKTVSVWTPLIDPSNAHLYINPFYTPVCGLVYPNCSMKKLALWEGAYMRHDPEARARAGLAIAERAAATGWRYKKLREKLRDMGLDLDQLDPEPSRQANVPVTPVTPVAPSPAAATPAVTLVAAAPAPPASAGASVAAPSNAATVAAASSPSPARPLPSRPPTSVLASVPSPMPLPAVPAGAATPSAATASPAPAPAPVPSPSASPVASATPSTTPLELPSRPPPSRPPPILPSVAAASVLTSTTPASASAAPPTPKSAVPSVVFSPAAPPTTAAATGVPPSPAPPRTPTPLVSSNGRSQLHVRADSSGTPSPSSYSSSSSSSRVRNSDSPVRTPTKKMAELLSKFQ